MSHLNDTLQDALEQHLEALKSGEDPDAWMRDLLEWLLQEVLDLEFSQFLGAEPYERSQDRKGYRNGYYQRELFTRAGRLTLRVPRDRKGRFSTDIFERYQRSEKALVLALQESYLQGVSTRKVKKITEKLCGVQFTKDQVSSMAQELDEELATWRTRALEMAYPYLIVDAHDEYVREDGQVESDGVLLVKGIRADGYREILSVFVAPTEEEATWNEVFSDLLERGLDADAVECITSDEHKGLRKAMRRYFPKATWQRCQTHSPEGHASRPEECGREGACESSRRSSCRIARYLQRTGCRTGMAAGRMVAGRVATSIPRSCGMDGGDAPGHVGCVLPAERAPHENADEQWA